MSILMLYLTHTKLNIILKNIVLLGVAYEDSIIFNKFNLTKEPIADSLKENITDKYLG